MAIMNVDTNQLSDISREIISYSLDLEREINNLFKRFSDVPYVTGEWVGNQSIYYFNTIKKDKEKYLKIVESLKKLGYEINKNSDTIDSYIRNNKIIEKSGR